MLSMRPAALRHIPSGASESAQSSDFNSEMPLDRMSSVGFGRGLSISGTITPDMMMMEYEDGMISPQHNADPGAKVKQKTCIAAGVYHCSAIPN